MNPLRADTVAGLAGAPRYEDLRLALNDLYGPERAPRVSDAMAVSEMARLRTNLARDFPLDLDEILLQAESTALPPEVRERCLGMVAQRRPAPNPPARLRLLEELLASPAP
jgi:hypothetical protein